MRISWALIALLGLACGAAKPAKLAAAHPPTEAQARRKVVSDAWLTSLDRDHTLVGKLWDVRANAFLPLNTLIERLSLARFVFLGERHDNPDHHRLQGHVLSELIKRGRRPAVVFEMLEVAQQPAIDDYMKQSGATAEGFGSALGWEKTGWPPFDEYRPIFQAAFAGRLVVAGGNVTQAEAKALARQGLTALPAERAKELRLEQPIPAGIEAPLLQELRVSHCGQLPESALKPMALAQHARDAQMAKVLAHVGTRDGAVLISGGGHARLDRGAPYYLALDLPDVRVASLVFREVRHGAADPRGYLTDEGPFDYVWFTPRANDDDPCAAFQGPRPSLNLGGPGRWPAHTSPRVRNVVEHTWQQRTASR